MVISSIPRVISRFSTNHTTVNGSVSLHLKKAGSIQLRMYNRSFWCNSDIKCVDEYDNNPVAYYHNVTSKVESIDFTFTGWNEWAEWTPENYLMHANHPFDRTSYKGCSVTPQLGGLIILILVVFIAFITAGLVCIGKMARNTHAAKKEDLAQNSLLSV